MGDFLVQMIYIVAIFTCGALMGEKYGANRRNPR
jgi:DNA-directed RNA polymerase subunit N (RpoN/RPB10)